MTPTAAIQDKPLLLLVDDQPSNLHLLAEILRDDYRITTTTRGAEVPALACSEPQPDLILLDVMMPDLNGMEVLRLLRADRQTSDIPVIFVSADATEHTQYTGLAYGADDYLVKPIQPRVLFARVRNLLRRKQAEDERQKSEQRFRAFFENEPNYCYQIAPDGLILDANPSALRAIGFESKNQIAGRLFVETAFAPNCRDKARQLLQILNETGAPINEELCLSDCKGELRTIVLTVSVVKDKAGKLLFILAIQTDITERKQYEDELKRSNDELDQFAYAVSHDMRQPLRMVNSYLSLIEKTLAKQLDEDTREYIRFATDGAQRMDQMILAILDFSRIGRKTDPMMPIESREVLDETLRFLKPDITAKAATVEVTGEWTELTVSRDELTRLLQNLIGNALKYHIQDKPPRVEIHAAATPALFRVTIRDHGIGIDPKQTDRLFKVFSRLQNPARFEGTGVGLALCRKIVEHHGGRIGVESEGEGLGSTFWFELPRISAPQKPCTTRQESGTSLNHNRPWIKA